jgi:toxin-antitoxin system PIN domain toxin
MILTDVNVLVYAHRSDSPGHDAYRKWLEDVVNGDLAYAVSDLVLSGFVHIVTHPRVFAAPSDLASALAFADEVRSQPNAVPVTPGPRHWEIFRRLCEATGARGNLVADAYLAALAIESGSEWITTDRDFSRFPGLRWRHPLAGG